MSWERFKHYYLYIDTLNFGIDVSRVDFDDVFLNTMEPKIQACLKFIKKGGAKSVITEAKKLEDKSYGSKITMNYE